MNNSHDAHPGELKYEQLKIEVLILLDQELQSLKYDNILRDSIKLINSAFDRQGCLVSKRSLRTAYKKVRRENRNRL